ncbi:mutator type transposase [Tanacetum coccineum]
MKKKRMVFLWNLLFSLKIHHGGFFTEPPGNDADVMNLLRIVDVESSALAGNLFKKTWFERVNYKDVNGSDCNEEAAYEDETVSESDDSEDSDYIGPSKSKGKVEVLAKMNVEEGYDLDDFDMDIDCDSDVKSTKERKRALRGLRGFKEGLRDLLGLDGCFIKGQYPGQLLTAVGIDANHGIYPLAYAIVESENQHSWSWVFEMLREDMVWFPKCNGTVFLMLRLVSVYRTHIWNFKLNGKMINLNIGLVHIFSGRDSVMFLIKLIMCEVFNGQFGGWQRMFKLNHMLGNLFWEYLMKRIVNVKKVISKSAGPLTPAATKLFEFIKDKASFIRFIDGKDCADVKREAYWNALQACSINVGGSLVQSCGISGFKGWGYWQQKGAEEVKMEHLVLQ